jgi:hypothetical protein
MTRLLTASFAEQLVASDCPLTMWSVTGTPTFVVESGIPGMRCATTAATAFVSRQLAASYTSGDFFFKFYIRRKADLTAVLPIVRWRNSGGGEFAALRIKPVSHALQFSNQLTSTLVDSTQVLNLDSRYRVEVRIRVSATLGQLEGRLYLGEESTPLETFGIGDFPSGNGTNENTLLTNFQRFELGVTSTLTDADLVFDNFIMNNDLLGGVFATWIGPSQVITAKPDSIVGAAQWEDGATGAPSLNNATNLADVPGTPNDATFNRESNSIGTIDRLRLTNMPAQMPSDATLVSVDVYGRLGSNQTSTNQGRFKLWDEAGTVTDGPNIEFNINPWKLTAINEHLVYNAAGKTKANLDSFDVGYESTTQATRQKNISALWVNVEFRVPEGPAATYFRHHRA